MICLVDFFQICIPQFCVYYYLITNLLLAIELDQLNLSAEIFSLVPSDKILFFWNAVSASRMKTLLAREIMLAFIFEKVSCK